MRPRFLIFSCCASQTLTSTAACCTLSAVHRRDRCHHSQKGKCSTGNGEANSCTISNLHGRYLISHFLPNFIPLIVSQIAELSWDKTDNKPVIVIGASNRPDSLDPALRRAGRFDHEICLGVPDEEARAKFVPFVYTNFLQLDHTQDPSCAMLQVATRWRFRFHRLWKSHARICRSGPISFDECSRHHCRQENLQTTLRRNVSAHGRNF